MSLIFNKKAIAYSAKTLQTLLEKFSPYKEELELNGSDEENYDATVSATNLISGSIQTIQQGRDSLQVLVNKLQRDYEAARAKSSKKDVEKELEEIENQTNFTENVAMANEMIFMLSARLTEAKNQMEKLARKLGYKIPITKNTAQTEIVMTNSAKSSDNKDSDGLINPADAMWLSDESPENSQMAVEDHDIICRTLKPQQMKLPRFYGDDEEFPEFWAIYTTLVDQSKNLSTVEKMLLLRDSLKGRAEMAVKGIQLVPQNYKWMTEELKRKFGNKPINRTKIVQRLVEMQPANGSAESCMAKYDKIRMLINQMVSAGQDIRHIQDAMWTEKILEKFPYHIVKNVLITIQHNEEVTINNVMEEIDKEITAKMFVDSRLKNRFKDSSRTQGFPQREEPKRKGSNCVFCGSRDHAGIHCKAIDVHAKRNIVREKRLCWKCFADNHSSFNCSWTNCPLCGKAHSKHLCIGNGEIPSNRDNNVPYRSANNSQAQNRRMPTQPRFSHDALRNRPYEPRPRANQANIHTADIPQMSEKLQEQHSPRSKEQIVLMTAEGNVWNNNSHQYEKILFFFDTGAQKTLIKEETAAKLGLPRKGAELCTMSGIGGHIEQFKSNNVQIQILSAFGEEISFEIQTKPVITNGFPSVKLSNEDKQFLQRNDIYLCNPRVQGETQNPQVLVGLDYYYSFMLSMSNSSILPSGLHIARTIFGPAIHGRGTERNAAAGDTPVIYGLTLVNEKSENAVLQNMFELDGLGILSDNALKDEVTYNYFKEYSKTISYDKGYATAPFPLKDNIADLADNYPVAQRRLISLWQQLQKNCTLKEWYCKILADYLKNDIIEEVKQTSEQSCGIYYMPHSGVWKPHKPKPLRIVFDASSKQRGQISLNEVIATGESFTNKIHDILIASRFSKIIVLCDIEAAFTQIRLPNAHRDLCRFLWIKNTTEPPVKSNILQYRFKRLPFGITASPSILNMVLMKFLDAKNTTLSKEIAKSLYVDNIMLQAESASEAIVKCKLAKEMFAEIGLNLREFISNCKEVNDAIPEKDRLAGQKIKFLGVDFDIENDKFSVETKFSPIEKLRKKDIVSQLNSVYDPIGLAAPLLIKLKSLMREIYTLNIDWKDTVPDELRKKWHAACLEVNDASITVPRCITDQRSLASNDSLWVFADASKMAMAVCAFLRCTRTHEVTGLISGKTRLTPKKVLQTIPRLELVAIVLALRLATTIAENVKQKFGEVNIISDSEIALSWINSSRKVPIFVANQVDRIKKLKQNLTTNGLSVKFGHVPSEFNPADAGTRGLSATAVYNHSWINGPSWLTANAQPPQIKWMAIDWLATIQEEVDPLDECTTVQHSNVEILTCAQSITTIDLSRFSNLSKALRSFATAAKLLNKWAQSCNRNRGSNICLRTTAEYAQCPEINATDLGLSEKQIISELHKSISSSELSKRYPNQKFIRDNYGIIRFESRIQNANISYDTKNPIYIPKDSDFARLLVHQFHIDNAHAGKDHTLSLIRQKYWIPQPSRTVKKVIGKCIICKRFQGLPFGAPAMPSLPTDRVVITKTFQNVGVDFMGPFDSKSNEKMYICLYTCLTTRAIHLEVTENLSTSAFLNSFLRFISRRGVPQLIRSDCGTNFKLGQLVIDSLFKEDEVNGESVMSYSAKRNIKWIFNPPVSPWMGGVWERLVGIVKRSFQKAVGRKKLSFEEMTTITAQIEAIINTRPITKFSGTDIDEIPLRPVDFLQGNLKFSIPIGTRITADDDEYDPEVIQTVSQAKEAFEFSEIISNKFWDNWNIQYLTLLRDTQKRHLRQPRHKQEYPRIGEIVLLEQELIPRGCWLYGKIIEIIPSKDNEIRTVKLLMPNKRILQRPVNRIYPLEIHCSKSNDDEAWIRNDQSMSNETRGQSPPQPLIQSRTETIDDSLGEDNLQMITPEPISNVKRNPTRASKTRAYDTIQRFEQSLEEPSCSGSSSALVMLSLLLNLATSTCGLPANVNCEFGKVQIQPPKEYYELCFDDECRLFNGTDLLVFNLPRTPTDKSTIIQLKALKHGKLVTETRICEPPKFCDESKALLSKHLFGNPHCWPVGAIISVAVICYCTIAMLMIGVWSYRRFHNKIRQPVNFQTHTEAHPELFLMNTFHPLPLRATAVICAIIMICSKGTYACQHGYMRHSAELVCTNDQICTYEYDQEILFNHIDSEICIEIMHANKSVGLIMITKRYTKMKCTKVSHYFTRDTAHKIFHITRCAEMGSCTIHKCNSLWPNEIIEEFNEARPYPGYSSCAHTCGGLPCGCLLPLPACSFLRLAHIPLTETVYEIISCLDWEPVIELEIITRIQNLKKVQNATLIPYKTENLGTLSITAIALQKPHYSLMEKRFALAKKEAFLLPDEYQLPVQCSNSNMAVNNFSKCTNHVVCMCENFQSPNTCHCPDSSLEKLRFEHSNHLPISTNLMEITSEDMELYTYTHEGETTLAVKSSLMLDSASYVVIEPCKITPGKLSGCYECTEGSTLDVACFTQIETWVTIQCETQVFSIHCDENNKYSNITMEFDHAIVHEKCRALCAKENQEFVLEGTLYYHPKMTPRTVFESIEPEISSHNWSMQMDIPDLYPLLRIIKSHWHAAIAAIGGITAMLGITYLCGPTALLLGIRILWTLAQAVAKVTWQAMRLAYSLLAGSINIIRVIMRKSDSAPN